MIIGRGIMAQTIPDREGFTFFACGESNRFPLTEDRKERERDRLLSCDKNTMLVYLSGLNIYYPDTDGRNEYLLHKLSMEKLVKETFDNYCIFRFGTITWGDNPNTIINHIRKEITEKGFCKVRDGYRYLNTKEELQHWFNLIPKTGKHEMNITGQITWVPDLVEMVKQGKI